MAPEIVSDDDSMEVAKILRKKHEFNFILTRSSMERKLSGREER